MTDAILLAPVVVQEEPVTICAWCAALQTREGAWVQAGSYEREGRATHGICPPCDDRVRAEAGLSPRGSE